MDLDLIKGWLHDLSDADYDLVVAALELLEERGPGLGRPLVDTVSNSSYKNMKELRPGSKGSSEIRILFAFDPKRRAILLVAGDKQGEWNRWYRTHIPVADATFAAHLEKLAKADQDANKTKNKKSKNKKSRK